MILMPYVDERTLLRRNILDHSNLSFPDIFRYLNCLKGCMPDQQSGER